MLSWRGRSLRNARVRLHPAEVHHLGRYEGGVGALGHLRAADEPVVALSRGCGRVERDVPVAGPEVCHALLVQLRPAVDALRRRPGPVALIDGCVLEVSCRPPDREVVVPQVVLLLRVQLGADRARRALVIEAHFRLGGRRLSALQSGVAVLEVGGADVVNEVLVGLLVGLRGVVWGEAPLVRRSEAILVAAAQLDGDFLRGNFVELGIALDQAVGARDEPVGGAVLHVGRDLVPYAEVGRLVFRGTIALGLPTAHLALAGALDELLRRVVCRRVLA